jgi:uncharacterized membrane protein
MLNKTGRIYELDFLRGIALILMIYFHITYDMKEIFGLPVVYESGVNYFIGKLSGIIFIFVSGISSTISHNNIKRGLKLLVIAMVITAATKLYNPLLTIKFGILHFLAFSILLSPLFLRLNIFLLPLLGMGIIFLSHYLTRVAVTFDFLFPLGITTAGFSSSDYYPLIPWFGVFLFGLALGKVLYEKKKGYIPAKTPETILNRIGRHTLIVYLAHQPVTIVMLSLYSAVR